ncbi:hypothetical protein Ddye_016619 [Dipteronia dyeriana]|uniref:Uncharacterized protein n=1 Tax=Dipteronia dyeriana TaxID=168575 RepID=A0AAD9U729_9ROSI|nr:hypothetical protein Ddye_016619 [Dipteronia dyeriana]
MEVNYCISLVVPFPLWELQSKWIAGNLSGRLALSSQEEMMKDVKACYSKLKASGRPKRYTLDLSSYQFEYDDWVAEQCGCPGTGMEKANVLCIFQEKIR